jgi:DNA-binding GntR family transcriptional regulator
MPRPRLVVRTLSERVFEVVRERIVRGELGDGVHVRQDALAAELGVSKIPLREALGRLEQEGLLVSRPNRGYVVPPMSHEQADEIFALRLSIEPAEAAYAARLASTADRDRVQKAYRELEAAAHQDLAAVAGLNREFHTALVRPGGRALTTSLVERLSILAERYVVAQLKPHGRDARAQLEHRELADAWLARDERLVQALLSAHIQGTLDDLRAGFGTQPRRPPDAPGQA